MWGLLAPLFGAYVAYNCFATGTGEYSFSGYLAPRFPVRGVGAFAVGVEFTSVATFLHFHYFWACVPMMAPLRWLFTRLSAAVFVVVTIFLIYYVVNHPEQTKEPSIPRSGGLLESDELVC